MHALDALGNPIRRDILVLLRDGALAVHDIAEHFPVSRPAISRHVRLLEQAGLVEAHRQGRESLYSVRLQGFATVREYLDAFWHNALERLALLAREEERSTR